MYLILGGLGGSQPIGLRYLRNSIATSVTISRLVSSVKELIDYHIELRITLLCLFRASIQDIGTLVKPSVTQTLLLL